MASFDQAGLEIYSDWFLIRGTKAPLEPNKLSGVLLQLAPGATAQQLRFGILANLPSVKVVSGESMLTSIRQGFSLAQRRAGAHGNHIRQHSIDGESAVLLTLEGRSNKKAAPCGGTAPGGCGAVLRPTGIL
jgi:hypothetical protein